MQNVTIARNGFDLDSIETYQTDDLGAFLHEHFEGNFPESARIYVNEPCDLFDVTPQTPGDVERLLAIKDDITVVVYPKADLGVGEVALIAALVAAVVVAVVMSNMPLPASANQTQPSPNNELSDRQNTARPNQRIPDIYGQVRSTPDLIALPYHVFENNVEVEYAYMCIGRGYYQILDIRDDTTPLATITGARASVYDPFTSPNFIGPYFVPNGSLANSHGVTLDVGGGAGSTLKNVRRLTGVNGQTLYAPNNITGETATVSTGVYSMAVIPFHDGNGYCFKSIGGSYGFSAMLALLQAGDHILVTGAKFTDNVSVYDFSGTYEWDDAGPNGAQRLCLKNVVTTGAWAHTSSLVQNNSGLTIKNFPANSVAVPTTALVPDGDTAEIWINVVAENGAYQLDNSGNATALTINLQIDCQPADANGNPFGTIQTETFNLVGINSRESVGLTHKVVLAVPGPTLVTVRRTSASPASSSTSDVCQWKDLYGVTDVNATHFGNVTTVQTVTRATAGALSVKERKLNMLVQRLLPINNGDGTFGALAPTSNFIDAIISASLDPYIGNRQIAELDFANFAAVNNDLLTYFGKDEMRQFSATFDDIATSFEEIVSTIAQACFCTVYRRGATIQLFFEKKTANSVLLFNHRNKIPKSENRTVSFGIQNNYDCVEYNYVSDLDDSQTTVYFPTQGINPQKIDSKGVRIYMQAYVQAARAWQRLKYQNVTTVFDATEEAEIVLRTNRVLIADNTRSGTQDGEVLSQNIMELELSQKVVFAPAKSYGIHLQMVDGSTFYTDINTGSAPTKIIMQNAPPLPLSVDEQAAVRTVYWIVERTDTKPQAFLVTDRQVKDKTTSTVTAVNYDDRYYAFDQDPREGTLPVNPDAAI